MQLVEMLKNQAGRFSVGRVCAVVTFCLWIFTWLYTLLLNKTYAHFDTVTIAMLIMLFVIIMSKTVDSKFISIKENSK